MIRYWQPYVFLSFALSACDFGGDAIATLKSPVISALKSPSTESVSQLRVDSLAIGGILVEELREDLVSGGLDLVQANTIAESANKTMRTGTLAIGLALVEDESVTIQKPLDVAALVVKGAIDALDAEATGLADMTARSSFTSTILDSSIESVTAPGRASSEDLAALAQSMVGQAVASLDDAGFGDSTTSGASAITQGAMQSLSRQSGIGASVLTEVAQSVATGAVAAIKNSGVSAAQMAEVARSLTQGAVTALSSASAVDDAQMAEMVKGIAKGAVKGISSSVSDESAKAALASSVTQGAVGGLSAASGRELSSMTKAVTEGAVSGIKDVGSSDIAAVAQSIASGAMSGLSNVGSDATAVASLASSVAAGAIGGLKDSGVSEDEVAKAAGGAVQGAISGLSDLNLKDANGSSSANLTEAVGLVTEGAMSSLSDLTVTDSSALTSAMASASMTGLSALKTQVEAQEGAETLHLATAASRAAQGAVKAIEAQNDGTTDLGAQLQAMTGGMVGSLKSAGFSESELAAGAGAITSGAVKGFEKDESTSFVSDVMTGAMGNLDEAGMSDADIANAMSDIVGQTMEAVATTTSSSSEASNFVQEIVAGAVQGLDGAAMSDTTAVQSAVQGIARGATSSLQKAGVSSADMGTVASAVTKTSIQELSTVKVDGAALDARNIQAMASKVAKGTMEGYATASTDFSNGGHEVPPVTDFADDLSKGAIDALKGLKDDVSGMDFGDASSDLAGAILEGAAQGDANISDLQTQLNTTMRENVASELTSEELDALETEIAQKASQAEALSSALDGDSFLVCHETYGDEISDDDFYDLLPTGDEVILCERSADRPCPGPRLLEAMDVNWYPLASQDSICELEIFSQNAVLAGDFDFQTLPSKTNGDIKIQWKASENTAFYGFKIAKDEGCQDTLYTVDDIPSDALERTYSFPQDAVDGTWYVCLGARTQSFDFTSASPPYRSIVLDRTAPAQATLSFDEPVLSATPEIRWTEVPGATSYVLKVSLNSQCQTAIQTWSHGATSRKQTLSALDSDVVYALCLEVTDDIGNKSVSYKGIHYSTSNSNSNSTSPQGTSWISESQDKDSAYFFKETQDEGVYPYFSSFVQPVTIAFVSLNGGHLHVVSQANNYMPQSVVAGDSLSNDAYWQWIPDSSYVPGQDYDVFDYTLTDGNGDSHNLTAKVHMTTTDGDDSVSEPNSNDEQFYGGFGGDTLVGSDHSDELLADSELGRSILYSHAHTGADPIGWFASDMGGPSAQDSYPSWHSASDNSLMLTRTQSVGVNSEGRGAVIFSGASDPGFHGYFTNNVTTDFSAFVVAKIRSNPGILFSVVSSLDQIGVEVLADGRIQTLPALATPIVSTTTLDDNELHIIGFEMTSNGDQSLYVDGVLIGTTSGGLPSAASNFYLGKGYNANTGLDGEVAEIILYDEPLSQNDREGVERYLSYRSGVSVQGLSFGADTLTGGGGRDVFSWSDMSYSFGNDVDVITDFNQGDGDLIDVRGFSFVDLTLEPGQTFSGRDGQVIATVQGQDTLIQADFRGDQVKDFEILLKNFTSPLTKEDFVVPVVGEADGVNWREFLQASRSDRGFPGALTLSGGGESNATTWASVPHGFDEGGRAGYLTGFAADGEGWKDGHNGFPGRALSFQGQSFVSLPDLYSDSNNNNGVSFVVVTQLDSAAPSQDRMIFEYKGKSSSRQIQLIHKTDQDVVLDLGVTQKSLGYQYGGHPLVYIISISNGGMLDVTVNGVKKVDGSYDASGWSIDDTMEGRIGQDLNGVRDFHGQIALFAASWSSMDQSKMAKVFANVADMYRVHPLPNINDLDLVSYFDAANNMGLGFEDMSAITGACAGQFPMWQDLYGDGAMSMTNFSTCDASGDSWLGDGSSSDPYRMKFKDSSSSVKVNTNYFTDITVEAWVRLPNVVTSCDLLRLSEDANPSRYYSLGVGSVGDLSLGGDSLPSATGSDIDDGGWHHIALVLDTNSGATSRLYLNGVQTASSTLASNAHLSSSQSDLHIGKFAIGCAAEFGAVRVYTTGKSQTDIQSNCDAEKDRYAGSSCGP